MVDVDSLTRVPDPDLGPTEQRFIDFFEGAGAGAFERALAEYTHESVVRTYPHPVRVDWRALAGADRTLASDLTTKPGELRTVANHAIRKAYRATGTDTGVITTLRPVNLPDEHTHRIDLIRSQHLNELIAVDAEVVEVNPVEPMLTEAAFECRLCGTLTRLPQKPYAKRLEPSECAGCDDSNAKFRLSESQSELDDCQLAKVKAADPALDSPRILRVFLQNDLCGRIRKEEQLGLVGVYKILPYDHPKQKSTNMETYLRVVALEKEDTAAVGQIDDSELADHVVAYVADHEDPATTDDEQWYVDRAEVEEAIATTSAAAVSDVQACIDELLEENELIRQPENRLAA